MKAWMSTVALLATATAALDRLAISPNPVPLPAGTYSVWVQELGGTVPDPMDFVVTQVPEPATWISLGLGLLGLGCRRFVLQRR